MFVRSLANWNHKCKLLLIVIVSVYHGSCLLSLFCCWFCCKRILLITFKKEATKRTPNKETTSPRTHTLKPDNKFFLWSAKMTCLGGLLKLETCFQVLLFIVLLVVNKRSCSVQADNWEYKLVHDILEHYDSSIRPSLSHNMTLNVTFGLALAQLIDVVS